MNLRCSDHIIGIKVGKALAFTGNLVPVRDLQHGDIVSVEVSQKSDSWESNWYKVITGTAVLVGIYSTVRK